MSSSSGEPTDALSCEEPFILSAMDPGATTGLSLYKISPDTYSMIDQRAVEYNVETRTTPIMVLKEWANSYIGFPHFLVYEPFHIRPGMRSVNTTALNVIGGLEHWLMEENPYVEVASFLPHLSKNLATDDVLKKCGLYVKKDANSRHVRDSARQMVTYLYRRKYQPLCRLAWPSTSVQSES